MGAEQGNTDVSGYVVPLVTLVIGVIVAALVAAMPQASLDLLTWRLWLPQIIPAATPPIGATGRTLLAVAALVPFVAAAALMARLRGRAPITRTQDTSADRMPTIRRADSHPDHPPRRPIRADEDLGPPLPIITIAPARGVPGLEQPLPADLDQPLAAFDPISIPDVPRQPVRAVPPLVTMVVEARDQDTAEDEDVPVLDFLVEAPEVEPPLPEQSPVASTVAAEPAATEMIASEPPTPAYASEPAAETGTSASTEDTSLADLLNRLERGAQRRKAPEPAPPPATPATSLDDTLVMLRRMARN